MSPGLYKGGKRPIVHAKNRLLRKKNSVSQGQANDDASEDILEMATALCGVGTPGEVTGENQAGNSFDQGEDEGCPTNNWGACHHGHQAQDEAGIRIKDESSTPSFEHVEGYSENDVSREKDTIMTIAEPALQAEEDENVEPQKNKTESVKDESSTHVEGCLENDVSREKDTIMMMEEPAGCKAEENENVEPQKNETESVSEISGNEVDTEYDDVNGESQIEMDNVAETAEDTNELDDKLMDLGVENNRKDRCEIQFDFDCREDEKMHPVHVVQNEEYVDQIMIFANNKQCRSIMVELRKQSIDGAFCDVTLKAHDGLYHAHRCVLAASGSYLPAVISESLSDVVDITPKVASAEVFEVLLHQMYTGDLRICMGILHDLLLTSTMLGLTEIQNQCKEYMAKNINAGTCFEILHLSKKFEVGDVERKAIAFISQSLLAIFRTESFLQLPLESVVEILKCQDNKRSEVEKYKLDSILHWVIHHYEERREAIPLLMSFVRPELMTKLSLERCFQQGLVRNHEIFMHEAILDFIEKVRKILSAKSSRTSTSATVTDEVPRRKRGRPPKKKGKAREIEILPKPESSDATTRSKRKRGRPRKLHPPMILGEDIENSGKEGVKVDSEQVFSRENVEIPTQGTTELPAEVHDETAVQENGDPGWTEIEIKKEFDPDIRAESADAPAVKPFNKRKLQALLNQVKKRALKRSQPLKCNTCDKQFTKTRQLTRHMQTHKPKDIHCDLCQFVTRRKDKLRAHFCRVHSADALDRGYMDEERYCKLQRSRAGKVDSIPKPKVPRCRAIVEDKDLLQCPKCPRKFPTPSKLSHHVKGHGADTPYLCDICGFSTRHFSTINNHRKQHKGILFKCPYKNCNFTNTRRSCFEDHINMHQGIRNYVCTVCGKMFANKKHMYRHEKLHVDVKPFACENCEYRSTRKDKLNEHIRKHHPNIAMAMGILDITKILNPKYAGVKSENPSQPTARKPRKKKAKHCTVEQSECIPEPSAQLKIDPLPTTALTIPAPTKQNVVPSTAIVEQQQPSNYVTMTIPPHLLGASAINEDMLQYLASMTSAGLVTTSHPQMHLAPVAATTNLAAQVIQAPGSIRTQPVLSIDVGQLPGVQQREVHVVPSTLEQRGDTWVYLLPEDGRT